MRQLWSSASLRVAPAAALALLVVIAGDAFLTTSDVLPHQVQGVLAQAHENHEQRDFANGLEIIHVCWRVSDTVRGFQIGLMMLLFGGIPAALVAAALRNAGRYQRWSADWSTVFAAGLVFQLSSFAFTSLLLAVTIAVVSIDALVTLVDAAPAMGVLLLCSICSGWGLRSWRTLEASAYEEPLRIIAR